MAKTILAETTPEVAGQTTVSLLELPQGRVSEIVGFIDEKNPINKNLHHRLAELGFLRGERVRVIARGFAGGEPIAVRIGTATFALRRFEAECIRVQPLSQ